jgi:DNA relaxase NicK
MEEKRELLVIKLLTSKAKASNIPLDILIITTRYINFLFIIINNICKIIIKAGNTILGVNKVLIIIL